MLWCFHLFNTSTIRQVNILLDGWLTEYTQITLSVYKYDKGRQQQPKFHSFITHPHSEPRYKRDLYLAYIIYYPRGTLNRWPQTTDIALRETGHQCQKQNQKEYKLDLCKAPHDCFLYYLND